jgi:hypothetical protein
VRIIGQHLTSIGLQWVEFFRVIFYFKQIRL